MIHIHDAFDKLPREGKFIKMNCGKYALNKKDSRVSGPIGTVEVCRMCMREHNIAMSLPDLKRPKFCIMLKIED